MRCPRCGFEAGGSRFCPNCGQSLAAQHVQPPAALSAESVPTAQPPVQPPLLTLDWAQALMSADNAQAPASQNPPAAVSAQNPTACQQPDAPVIPAQRAAPIPLQAVLPPSSVTAQAPDTPLQPQALPQRELPVHTAKPDNSPPAKWTGPLYLHEDKAALRPDMLEMTAAFPAQEAAPDAPAKTSAAPPSAHPTRKKRRVWILPVAIALFIAAAAGCALLYHYLHPGAIQALLAGILPSPASSQNATASQGQPFRPAKSPLEVQGGYFLAAPGVLRDTLNAQLDPTQKPFANFTEKGAAGAGKRLESSADGVMLAVAADASGQKIQALCVRSSRDIAVVSKTDQYIRALCAICDAQMSEDVLDSLYTALRMHVFDQGKTFKTTMHKICYSFTAAEDSLTFTVAPEGVDAQALLQP